MKYVGIGPGYRGTALASSRVAEVQMRIVVVGANGRLGALIVAVARARGRHCLGIARGPGEGAWAEGDAGDVRFLRSVLREGDVVISAIGPTRQSPQVAPTMAAMVQAMKAVGARRLVVVTGALIGGEHLGVVYSAMHTILGHSVDDRVEQERVTRESGLDWTIVRPTRLTDGPATLHVRYDATVGAFSHISRRELAGAVVDLAMDPGTIGRAIGVSDGDRWVPPSLTRGTPAAPRPG